MPQIIVKKRKWKEAIGGLELSRELAKHAYCMEFMETRIRQHVTDVGAHLLPMHVFSSRQRICLVSRGVTEPPMVIS
jgi:hypothetical protein